MTFERPGAWGLVALAIPIVVLHLRWRRRREAEVPSLALWRDLGAPGTGRRGFRRVEDAVQLACLLGALAAFAAALAGPVTGAPPAPPRRLAVVLDVSATMNARDGGAVRFDAARDAAVAAIEHLGPQDDVVVWTAGAAGEVAVEPTRDLAAARAAVAALRPTLEPGRVEAALALARTAAGPSGTILVLTDAVGAARVGATAAGAIVGVAGDGRGPATNSGISDAALDEVEGVVRVSVLRTDGAPGPRTAALVVDGAEAARVPVPADSDAPFTLPLPAGAAGVAEVRLEPADDFPPDDVATFVLPSRRPLRVVVSAPARAPSPFLVEALRAMPALVDPAGAVLVSPDAAADAFADADLVVAEGPVPAAAPRDRPVLGFAAAGRAVARPALWSVGAHPVLEGADLAPLRLDAAAVLELAPGERAIVECAEGPVAAAGESGGVRTVRFGFRPEATTLPLEAAFPVLVRNAVRWLARPAGLPPSVRAGEAIVTAAPLPPGDRVWVEGPGALPPRPVRVAAGAITEPAPYPPPGGPRILRVRGLRDGPRDGAQAGAATAVNRFVPPGFTLSADASAFVGASAAAASLPDRRGSADTRTPWAAECAAAGALLLAAGAFLLGRGGGPAAAPRTGSARPGNVDPVPGRD